MTDGKDSNIRPINWARLNSTDAERVIRQYAGIRSNVIFSEHALDQIEDREIVKEDVHWILENGYAEPDACLNKYGDWEVIVSRELRGARRVGVVTIVLREREQIFIKTVMWRDK